MARNGITVNSWVGIDRDCSVSCDVVGEQAQFEFGNVETSLNLVADEDGLVLLHRVAGEALARLQQTPPGQEVSFTVRGDQVVTT